MSPTCENNILKDQTIILGVTGSIAAYKAAELARLLIKLGAKVHVCLSKGAEKFIGAETFRGITGNAPYSGCYAQDISLGAEPHITLGKIANLMVVVPTTASSLTRLVYGPADEPVALTSLNIDCELLVAPAMSSRMWEHPQTQETVQILKQRGVQFLGPVEGELASSDIGIGRMLEPAHIANLIRAKFGKLHGPLKDKKIVISAGGTKEAIDPVRYLSNHSSGKMGLSLAEAACDLGAEVTLVLSGKNDETQVYKSIEVESATHMKQVLEEETSNADYLIMAAAVSDYRPETYSENKLKKSSSELSEIKLVQNPDILAEISHPQLKKIGFALEDNNLLENAKQKLESKGLSLIVANSLETSPFGSDENKASLISATGVKELPMMSKYELARSILNEITEIT